jgi:hypothetical protein
MVFSFLIFIISEFQLRYGVNQREKEITRLEKELAALRNLPLEESEGVQDESQLNM